MTGEEYAKFVIAGLDRREYAKARKVAGQKRKREEPKLHIELLPKQEKFVFERGVDEIMYGGAAGGGKSAAQCIAALLYAIDYPGSTQLMLRRTFVELEGSLIKEHFKHFPGEPWYRYNSSKHVGTLWNGSTIRFGYCASENDVFQYQGAEFDVIRLDEATHFTYEDVMMPTGAVIKQKVQKKIPAFSPVYKDGEPVMEEADEPVLDDTGEPLMQRTPSGAMLPQMRKVLRPKTAPTKLPYYKPKRLPVICRRNVSVPKSLYGQSDCEVIRPQQQEINKLESRIHDKLMRSGAIEFHRRGVAYNVSGGIFDQSIEVPEGQIARDCVGSITCEMSIQQDMQQSERQYEMAKRNIGITDSYVGERDNTAQSGVAKQQQVLQSSGRLESKRVEKYAAYADIDRAMFELYLAYADEPRNVPYTDDEGDAQVDVFSRYSFLEFDAVHGEWYYNDDYTFAVEANGSLEQQRDMMWQMNANDLASGAMGDPADPNTMLLYWRLQEKAHRPNAQIMVSHFRKLVTDLQNAQMMADQEQNAGESRQNPTNIAVKTENNTGKNQEVKQNV